LHSESVRVRQPIELSSGTPAKLLSRLAGAVERNQQRRMMWQGGRRMEDERSLDASRLDGSLLDRRMLSGLC
jgi:hypothetical protein